MLAYAEVKAIVGGTTAIQGAPGTSQPYEGFLVRNVDNETFGAGKDMVSQSALTLELDELKKRAEKMDAGSTFVYHLAEGSRDSPKLLDEFGDVADGHCLKKRLVAIHATALGVGEFQRWSPHAGSVVWSPFSNLWLYRTTTDVVAAHKAGLRICLGSDWGPSGSKNVLGELKVADLWNREHLAGAFSDQELCEMVTSNPADALEWTERTGRLKQGLQADVLVVDELRRRSVSQPDREHRSETFGLCSSAAKPRYGRTASHARDEGRSERTDPASGPGPRDQPCRRRRDR